MKEFLGKAKYEKKFQKAQKYNNNNPNQYTELKQLKFINGSIQNVAYNKLIIL